MSAYSNRKRPRRLGQPLFPIEDPATESAPARPLAELTADLDAALADRHQRERELAEPIGLRVPEDVRAALDRARRPARVTDAGKAGVPAAPTSPARVAADPKRSVGRAGKPVDDLRPALTLGASTRSAGEAPKTTSGGRSSMHVARRGPATSVQYESTQARATADVAVAEPSVRYTTSMSLPLAEPLPTELLARELELPLPARRTEPPAIAGTFNHPLVMAAIGVISAVIIALAWMVSPSSPILSFQYANTGSRDVAANLALAAAAAPAPGNHRLRVAPSLSPEQIDQILRSYGSPAVGTGEIWYRLGVEYNIDPAYAVAFFIHESSAGTNPNWAGRKPDGSTTHNVGNIICAGYPTCYGRFRDYPNWETGIADWYRLIDVEYIRGRGLQTVAEVIPIYAPAFENDVQGYINVVTSLVDRWRAGQIP
ncbi:glucosaminidase domain-containing protein [Chloroflexus sp.]|uniref:glucosaminidase domain-containing protein n=1 Tax=Chloroflexus sp. TaxID=1904827 RepID=UPI002ACE2817|nr:glucosaminidase domain-containing protein [Chloroflexus sp.]